MRSHGRQLVDVLGFEQLRQARGAETPQHLRYKPGWAGEPRLRAHGEGRVARNHHTCAILDDDTLKCWGWNNNGRLGYGDTTDRTAPDATAVVDLGSGRTAKALSLGESHTCAILDDDTIKCWGGGNYIGYGDTTQREAPDATAVVNLGSGRTAKALSLGNGHTCAILDDDTLKCWGYGGQGQLGYRRHEWRGHTAGEMGDALLAINLGSGRTAKACRPGTSTPARSSTTTPSSAGV